MDRWDGTKAFKIPFWQTTVKNREPLYFGVAFDICLYVPKGIVLDIGTGTGRIPTLVTNMNENINCVGIDINDTMLRHATLAKQKAECPDRLCFMKASAEFLPFADESFNMIVSVMSIYQWHHRLQGCKEIYRVLKDSGTILIMVDNKLMFSDKSGLDRNSDLRNILSNAGFRTVIALHNDHLNNLSPDFKFQYLKPTSHLSGVLLVIGLK